jgi:hypothetical protein
VPTIATKIKHPSTNHLLVFKEGVFWVAYEQSAYYIAQLKKYKPTKKYLKSKFNFPFTYCPTAGMWVAE